EPGPECPAVPVPPRARRRIALARRPGTRKAPSRASCRADARGGPRYPCAPRRVSRLMAIILYGAVLRLLECCRLRIQDVDLETNQIVIRDGKGSKDRLTMLPAVMKTELLRHVARVRTQHQADLRQGAGWVELPWALARKYPNAGREWRWQWIFPATRT